LLLSVCPWIGILIIYDLVKNFVDHDHDHDHVTNYDDICLHFIVSADDEIKHDIIKHYCSAL
jgi:hypothetical protein